MTHKRIQFDKGRNGKDRKHDGMVAKFARSGGQDSDIGVTRTLRRGSRIERAAVFVDISKNPNALANEACSNPHEDVRIPALKTLLAAEMRTCERIDWLGYVATESKYPDTAARAITALAKNKRALELVKQGLIAQKKFPKLVEYAQELIDGAVGGEGHAFAIFVSAPAQSEARA